MGSVKCSYYSIGLRVKEKEQTFISELGTFTNFLLPAPVIKGGVKICSNITSCIYLIWCITLLIRNVIAVLSARREEEY